MANIYKGTLGLIGNTPLVEVVKIWDWRRLFWSSWNISIRPEASKTESPSP